MKNHILKLSLLCVLGTISIKSFGQASQNDTAYLKNTLTQTIANFNKSIGQESRLYNGAEYMLYDRTIKGLPLFPLNAEGWESGIVNYDGIIYKDVPMKYDIYRDVVAVLLYNKFSQYTLLSERVHDFSLSGHHFVRVNADTLNANDHSGISTGFYDQLYGGKIEILAKRVKTIQNSTNVTATLETYFIERNEYYIRKGNIYYSISGQSSLLKVLKDKKQLLQQYIRDNKIKFRRDPEGAMANIASYYDHLSN
jgi:hypothetical protein